MTYTVLLVFRKNYISGTMYVHMHTCL